MKKFKKIKDYTARFLVLSLILTTIGAGVLCAYADTETPSAYETGSGQSGENADSAGNLDGIVSGDDNNNGTAEGSDSNESLQDGENTDSNSDGTESLPEGEAGSNTDGTETSSGDNTGSNTDGTGTSSGDNTGSNTDGTETSSGDNTGSNTGGAGTSSEDNTDSNTDGTGNSESSSEGESTGDENKENTADPEQGSGTSGDAGSSGGNGTGSQDTTQSNPDKLPDKEEEIVDPAASIENAKFNSLSDAISALKESGKSGTVVILKDISEDITIPMGADVEIDLNGHTLTNVKEHTIRNSGTLVISDSSEDKTGKVDNVTPSKAALYNGSGATATLISGNFDRSEEKGSPTADGGNSFCTIRNLGTLTIKEDVNVTLNGSYSSVIQNGWQNSNDNSSKNYAILLIEGGCFSGGLYTIENNAFGEVSIESGTFEGAYSNALRNYNLATIKNGTFSTAAGKNGVVLFTKRSNAATLGEMFILGGDFTGKIVDEGDTEISGGTFTNEIPDGAIKAGYEFKQLENGKYTVIPAYKNDNVTVGNIQTIIPASLNVTAGGQSLTSEQEKSAYDDLSAYYNDLSASQAKPEGLSNAFKAEEFLNETGLSASSINLLVTPSVIDYKLNTSSNANNTSAELTLKAITFEIYPQVVVNKNDGSTEIVSLKDNNSSYLNGENISFILPVPSSVKNSYAKITHQSSGYSDETSYSLVFGDENNKFISASTTHFSTFVIEFTDSIPNGYVSSGSGSGGSGTESISKATIYASDNGSWQLDARGWWFRKNDGSWPKSEWMECTWNGASSWYHFNAEGYADAGWFTDTDGQRYFLHDLHDGRFGYMYTGWNKIGEHWYYFNTETKEGRSKGALLVNGLTPDGFRVNADGIWTE